MSSDRLSMDIQRQTQYSLKQFTSNNKGKHSMRVKSMPASAKRRRRGTLECRRLELHGNRNRSRRKETGGTYSITGHELTLTTSEDDYRRSLFSFQQRCINQIVTQSIGIHLKREINVIKKTKTNVFLFSSS